MAWKISYRNSFLRKFKKLDKNLQNKILDIADEIQAGNDCKKLKHTLSEFYSCHFNRKPEYRLLYVKYKCRTEKDQKKFCKFNDIKHTKEELQNCNGLIEFVLVDTREAFNKLYKMKKNQKINFLRQK